MFLSIFLLIFILNSLQFYFPFCFASFDDPQDKENAVKWRLEELKKLEFSPGNFYFSQIGGDGRKDYYGVYFVEADELNDWDIAKGGKLHIANHPNIGIEFGKNNKTGNLECFYYAWNWELFEKFHGKSKEFVENRKKEMDDNVKENNIYVDRIAWGETKKLGLFSSGQPDALVIFPNPTNSWKYYFRTIPLMFLPPEIPLPLNRVELEEMMNSMDVHDILRICSTAYFYRGFPKEDKQMRHKLLREDWNLFLMEGNLKCNLNYGEEGKKNSSAENGNKLLANGLIVYLYQINSDMYENQNPDNPPKCAFEATLSKYIQKGQILQNDDELLENGFNFHLAAIVGSAQLTNAKFNAQRDFWKWKEIKHHYKRSDYVVEDEWDDCAKNYAKSLQNGALDYMLRIEFHHKCAKNSSAEGEKLICKFKISPFRNYLTHIFDYKEIQNNKTARAEVDLANGEMILPNGIRAECARKTLTDEDKNMMKKYIDGAVKPKKEEL